MDVSEKTADLVGILDFAITEDAFYYNSIEEFLPFIEAGKPIFAAWYTDMDVDFNADCARGRQTMSTSS